MCVTWKLCVFSLLFCGHEEIRSSPFDISHQAFQNNPSQHKCTQAARVIVNRETSTRNGGGLPSSSTHACSYTSILSVLSSSVENELYGLHIFHCFCLHLCCFLCERTCYGHKCLCVRTCVVVVKTRAHHQKRIECRCARARGASKPFVIARRRTDTG